MQRERVDADLSTLDRAVLNAFQGGFPVVERPFEPAAAALRERGVEVSAVELCARVRDLDERGVLSRFGALVNAEEIGGAATLVATHAPPERFDEHAELVNAHREVAHNYERAHPHLNMWFVVSVADPDRVDEVLAEIEEETGEETYNLPKEREFRVEAKFLLDGPIPDGNVNLSDLGPAVERSGRDSLTPEERDLVLEIQGGLPVTETPYADVADALGTDTEWVVRTIKRFEREGKVRRVGVVPNHYALGYTENGMTVWDVPDDLVAEVGPEIASLDFVTHCYQRPRHEGVWPYNFFAMTHGRSEAESGERIEQVRDRMADFWAVDEEPATEADGESNWDTLFSTRILKKTGIRLDERAAANTLE
ncbi:Lrp/AsnC family transcriptional regulator [Halobium salinum]|uniref:siroheme decarboxylase n=1 Tax=Halobium salinum TaxID=1364940 RepID=A0ABD5P9B7_9EURY|nr:Lrp/AsnC family transcriptional regulator [Halobium salinum]